MSIYVDTSFLVSLYSLDANSAAAVHIMKESAADRYITVLGELEVVNALELRIFRKEVSRPQVESALQDFETDLRDGVFLLRPLTEQIYERAHRLSRQATARLGTRTADLLHVAAAIELDANYLYSFDQSQRKLAMTVGLKLN